ncbi:MAG TPA: acylphosphatase, partial [Aliarcobacter cryaerophilus]|nr:acylphosphatase [Aliarcobacter cryaerophilus]
MRVYGTVQGVGFRPFVYNLAIKYNLFGYVNNDNIGVNIEVSGKTNDISSFLEELKNNPPPLAVIEDIKVEDSNKQFFEFKIEKSSSFDNKTTTIPSDIAICKDCIDDIFDKNNFRYNYPLTNCTNCGPRYSIIKTIPYDRKNTSLKDFTLCKKCQNEFENSTNR